MKSCAKESGIDVTTYYDVIQNREWVVFERIHDTEQRIPCLSRLQSSSNRRVANSGGLHLLHHMRKSVTIARWNLLMFLGLKTCVLVVLCGHLKPANFAMRMAAQARWNSLLHAAKKNNNAAKFFVCSKQDNSDGFIGTP